MIGRHLRHIKHVRWLPAAVALGLLGLYLYVGARRVAFPYELEWMEGGAADHVTRLVEHQPLYVAPSADFVPYLYTPFYYWVCALFAKVSHVSLPLLRAVSFVSTLATFALIFDFVRRETEDTAAAIVAMGLYAATYPVCGHWYELARVDALALALVLGGAWLVRFGTSPRALVLAGVLWGLAHFTKQSMLLAILGPGLWLLAVRTRLALYTVVAGAMTLALTTLVGVWGAPHWYLYYTVELPRLHPTWPGGWRVIRDELVYTPAGVFAVLGTLAMTVVLRSRGAFYVALVGSGLATASFGMMHSGAAANVMMPGCAVLSVGMGLGASLLSREARPWLRVVGALVLVALAAQLVTMRWSARPQIPTAWDVAAGDQVVQRLRSIEGDVLVPSHGHYAVMAGKPMSAQAMAVTDIFRSSDKALAQSLRRDIVEKVRAKKYAAILVDDAKPLLVLYDLRFIAYPLTEDLFPHDHVGPLFTRTGLRCRPSALYVTKP